MEGNITVLKATVDLLKASLKMDPTVTPAERGKLIMLLRDRGHQPTKPELAQVMKPRCIRRREAARILAVSLRTVDKLAASGNLKKRTLPGRILVCGFLESEVVALIS
jgi:hypothetical protein